MRKITAILSLLFAKEFVLLIKEKTDIVQHEQCEPLVEFDMLSEAHNASLERITGRLTMLELDNHVQAAFEIANF